MPEPSALTTPTFYLTSRQPLRPSSILLAAASVIAALSLLLHAMAHTRHVRLNSSPDRSTNAATGAAQDDDKDDPNQIDTIVLGDPADAPLPGKKGDHVSPVHPTILVRLPRFGDQVGLIPDSPAGRLLYAWLAAFNQANSYALGGALPTIAPGPSAEAQMALRRQSGGFNLVSAAEPEPGVLVFRLRDQTPDGNEVLGSLQVAPATIPPRIATFSLRAVPSVHSDPATAPAHP